MCRPHLQAGAVSEVAQALHQLPAGGPLLGLLGQLQRRLQPLMRQGLGCRQPLPGIPLQQPAWQAHQMTKLSALLHAVTQACVLHAPAV